MSYAEFLLSQTFDPATTSERQFILGWGKLMREQDRIWRTPGSGTNVADRRGSVGKKGHVKAGLSRADIV